MTDLQGAAVDDNARWVDTICRLHGLDGQRDRSLWWTPSRSPDFYPDAVTLSPDVSPDEVLSRVDDAAGCSVKDSFAALDLEPAGFRVLFDARWIGRSASPPGVATRLSWRQVVDRTDLARWAAAHGEAAALLPAVLTRPELRLFLAGQGGEVQGGLALHRGGPAVGVSNLFARTVGPEVVWCDVPSLAERVLPGLPLVGYERDEDLALAEAAGFARLGSLRVWIR